jgi:hypothetical protein
MGGDHAPEAEVAARTGRPRRVPGRLHHPVGRRTEAIEAELARPSGVDRRPLVESSRQPDVVGMGEKPLSAVRKKPNSEPGGRGHAAEGRPFRDLHLGRQYRRHPRRGTIVLGLHEGVARAPQ